MDSFRAHRWISDLWDCNTGGGLAPEVTISTTQSEEKHFWLLKVSLRQRLKREEALGAAGRDSPASTCMACEQSYHAVSLCHTHAWSSLAASVEQVEDRSSRFLLIIIIIIINLTNHVITCTRSLRRTLLPKPLPEGADGTGGPGLRKMTIYRQYIILNHSFGHDPSCYYSWCFLAFSHSRIVLLLCPACIFACHKLCKQVKILAGKTDPVCIHTPSISISKLLEW